MTTHVSRGRVNRTGLRRIAEIINACIASITRAIDGAHIVLASVIARARYWEKLRDIRLNDRQRFMINRLLEGFEGKLTTSKWAALAKCSHDTALRDIQELVERGVLTRGPAGGRSTSYALAGI